MFDDGTPVPKGMVIFERENYMSRSEIQPDGSYSISSERANDGIPPGEYKVYVSGIVETPIGIFVGSIPIPGWWVADVDTCRVRHSWKPCRWYES